MGVPQNRSPFPMADFGGTPILGNPHVQKKTMFAPFQKDHSGHFLKAISSVLLPQSSGCIKDDLKNQAPPAAKQVCVDLVLSENPISPIPMDSHHFFYFVHMLHIYIYEII